ncbi:MAG: glycosyltransferase family 39 protein [Bacteroidetes bacterium]|nr:MAG: glycosyltransferase family 39 protein [Bacteroidota bacterium]
MRKPLEKENIIFASIILIAFFMRIWNYGSWSFTHDELGAFVRLDYSSFSELIAQGIRDHDTHPAFTQLFIFLWEKMFGLSEASIRFPFILAGTGSVALLFYIAKKWFGLTAAYLSSLSLAILEFPVLYSQLARPYSFGLFFSLLTVWCWTRFLFESDHKVYRKAVYYGIATALCMLTHYFAFFFAMIIALTGFFFLKKETWKPYLLSGIIAIAVFLPHISVSLHQFSMGGIGEWLAKPGRDFLWKYILYGLNDSPLVVITIAIISMLSVLIYHLDISFSKFQAICVAWFLLPFLAGYYYSVEINPVLQYSVLIFSFPFLLLFLFSFFKEYKEKFNNLSYASLGIVLLFSTVIEKNFYKREDFGVFKEINRAVAEFQKKYGGENITTVLNTSSKDIFDFYFQQNNELIKFDFYAGDDSSYVADMLKKVDECETPYFIYGWSNFRSPYEIPEIIKRKYPCIIYDEQHFNSQITLFGKDDTCRRDTIFLATTGFENTSPLFSFDTTGIDTVQMHSGKHSLNIKPKDKYCITLRKTAKQLFKTNSCISISAWVYTKEKFDAQLVMDIGQPTGKRDWQAKLLPKFIKNAGQWQQIFATFELPTNAYPDDEVKIHLWNPGKNSFYLDDVTISSFTDSRYDPYAPSFRK